MTSQAISVALGEADGHAAQFAFRTDVDRLLVAAGRDVESRCITVGLDQRADLAVGNAAFNRSVNAPAGFAPRTGEGAAPGGHVAGQFELVAVAGAAKHLMKCVAAAIDRISATATDALRATLGDRDGAVAGPIACIIGKGRGIGMGERRRQQKGRGQSSAAKIPTIKT